MIEKKSLAYLYPELAKEWHPTKNGSLTPNGVTKGSNKKVWWRCSKDHEWEAVIAHRANGVSCPYCSNKKVLVGFNDLATTDPLLAKEWHPTKNENLKSTDITRGAGILVWWKCEKEHEWCATPNKRTTDGTGCPYCSNRKVLSGYNDLATTNPRLAKEWHPIKNGKLTPNEIVEGSVKKIWWRCEKGHEWKAAPYNRIRNRNCPICSKQLKTSFPEQALFYYIKKNFPDAENTNNTAITMELDIFIPSLKTAIEYDGVYYHKTKNALRREEKKNKLCTENDIKLIRVREKGLNSYDECTCISEVDPSNNSSINSAVITVLGLLGIVEQKVDVQEDTPEILNGYLISEHKHNLALLNPELAIEWNPGKNGELKPEHIAINSGKKVWWKCEKGHEWRASLHNRSKGKGCPYCSGRMAIQGENDLLTLYPEIVREWNYPKNVLSPNEVKGRSSAKVWWKCTICGNEWVSAVSNRTAGHGCPKCGELKKGPKRKTHEQFEVELRTINPLVKIIDRYIVSTRKVKCCCLICGHEWLALPGNLLKGKGCPACAKKS